MTSRCMTRDRGDDDLRPAGLRAPSPDQPLRRAATLGHRPSTLTSTILMSNLSTVRWGAPRPALLCQVTYSAPSRVAELARVDIHLGLRKSPPTASLRMLSSRPVTSPALNFELIGGDYVAPRGPRSQRGSRSRERSMSRHWRYGTGEAWPSARGENPRPRKNHFSRASGHGLLGARACRGVPRREAGGRSIIGGQPGRLVGRHSAGLLVRSSPFCYD